VLSLCLAGDVMTGRGIDQVLQHPGDPELREPHVHDARDYVTLAERRNGPVPAPVPPSWPWGDALASMDDLAPDVRVVNLETSITRSSDFAQNKVVHYRMTPDNLPAVQAGRPDVCVLANNHVLDFGRSGLVDTLDALAGAGVGAGRDVEEALRPAVVDLGARGRVVVHAACTGSSGVPEHWAATRTRPGVARLPDLSDATTEQVCDRIAAFRRPGDVTVLSVHWGSNWGYDVPREQTRFARRLVEAGVQIVHGHSSHHPRPVEVLRDGVILYGCGDLVNDYEGISGHEEYRSDLRLLYLVSVAEDGTPVRLRMVPLWTARLRLHTASGSDARWLARTLTRVSQPFGARVGVDDDGLLEVTSVDG
jgi:poly-gamma-glutamate capsule biosynthesis protein CapA/YwtB (metallophosphatase superfamily)